MPESRDYLEMTFKSINCFADDGKLDVAELQSIVAIALKDGEVDDNEKRVLNNIIARLNGADLTAEMQSQISDLKTKYQL